MLDKKEELKVGNCKMFAKTVPVKILLDLFDSDTNIPGCTCENFRLIESDGYYIVSREVYTPTNHELDYKCFLTREDATNYLEMFGVEIGKTEEERKDSDRFYS